MRKAGAATNRSDARLREEAKREKPVEIRFSLPDPWTRQMLIALCQRYGLAALSLSAHAAAKRHVGAPETS